MSYQRKGALWIGFVLLLFMVALQIHGNIRVQSALLVFGICFACELIDSGLGMGYGTILTPTLLFLGYATEDIVPTVLLSELLSGSAAAFFHNEIKNVELGIRGKDFLPAALLAGGSVIGVVGGVLLAVNLPKDVLKMMIGCIILTSGLFVILISRRIIVYRHWKMILLSAVASFNKAISGGGYGPLVTSGQILSGVQGKCAVGITSLAEAFTCLFASLLFLAQGGSINWTLCIPMCAGALISVPFSVFAINQSREEHLKMLIGVVTMAMGAFTIYNVLH